MTYRDLLVFHEKNMDYPFVRFKSNPESGKKLPPAGMVAQLDFIGTTEDIDMLDPPVESWKMAPNSIQVACLTFNFAGLTAYNAEFDEYDPGENSFPWLMTECGKYGYSYSYLTNTHLDDEIDWFEVVPEGEIRRATLEEIAQAQQENHETLEALRHHIVNTIRGMNKTDPMYIELMDKCVKLEDDIMTLLARE